MSNTVLLPQSIALYQASNLEPQYVTTQIPNTALIFLDSQDVILETNKVDIIMSTIKQRGESASTLAFGISRISIESFTMNWNTPNINPRNNTITFFSSASGLFHTVTIPEGFYSTDALIIAAVVTALNTATGSSGLTFSSAPITLFPLAYTLSAAGGNYYFSLTCSAITNGIQLYCLPQDQVATASKTVGPIFGLYTRYIDICSNTLSQFLKLKNTSTGKANNIISRIYFNTIEFSGPRVVGLRSNVLDTVSYNFPSDLPINTVDFQLRDQYGDLLYIPNEAAGTFGGFNWEVALKITL